MNTLQQEQITEQCLESFAFFTLGQTILIVAMALYIGYILLRKEQHDRTR